MVIEKYTFGVGDRFAHQAGAQLQAFVLAKAAIPRSVTIGLEMNAVEIEHCELWSL